MTVAEVIIRIVQNYGVRQIFGIPGDAINDLTDALRQQDETDFVLVRHEEAGALAAAAQAKLTGNLAVCMGTAGPGAIHLLNGLYDARHDHAPVLAITGQVETRYIGTSYHQEVDLERLFGDVAVYSQTITSAGQVPAVILEACRAAISARGVAHVSLPTDVAGMKVDVSPAHFPASSLQRVMRPDRKDCAQAVKLIDDSHQVAILAGIGAAGARGELLELADRLGAPIVRTLRAKDFIDDDDQCCIGGLGLLGSKPAIRAMAACDLLLMIGTDFPYQEFYPEQARVIQIDNTATQLGKRHRLDVGLLGDAAPTIAELLVSLPRREQRSFLDSMLAEKADWLQQRDRLGSSDATPIKPQRLVAEVSSAAPDDAIFLCDTGTIDAWCARHLSVGEGQRFTLSSGLGSMAFALPGALGAQLAYPDRRVIALTGDGGLNMLIAEFLTLVERQLPVVIVVVNNGKLGFIALEQEAKGLPEHSISFRNPDYVELAQACGGAGLRVEEPAMLADTLKEALALQQPVIVDVVVDPDELVMPPRIELQQAVNFTLAKARELIN